MNPATNAELVEVVYEVGRPGGLLVVSTLDCYQARMLVVPVSLDLRLFESVSIASSVKDLDDPGSQKIEWYSKSEHVPEANTSLAAFSMSPHVLGMLSGTGFDIVTNAQVVLRLQLQLEARER